jgi:hypothetical protein
MAKERSEHQQWADAQIAALIELGVSPLDSQRQVDWVLANLPVGEDPATYIFPANALWQEPSTQQEDSAANFIAKD